MSENTTVVNLLHSQFFTELKFCQSKSVTYVYFWLAETSVLRITWLVSSLRHPPHRVRGPGLAQKSFLSLWSIAQTFSVTYSKPGRALTRLKQWQGEKSQSLLFSLIIRLWNPLCYSSWLIKSQKRKPSRICDRFWTVFNFIFWKRFCRVYGIYTLCNC